jgi:hypothetical protein
MKPSYVLGAASAGAVVGALLVPNPFALLLWAALFLIAAAVLGASEHDA